MSGSPAAILFDINGHPMGVSGSMALPSGALGLIMAGVDPNGIVRYVQSVSGSVMVTGSLAATVTFPTIQTITGTVGISGITFPETINIATAPGNTVQVWSEGAVGVTGSVALINWPVTIGVSASSPLSVWNAGTVGVSGTVGITAAGSIPVWEAGPVGVTGSVALTNWPGLVGVTGSVNVYTSGPQAISGTVQVWSEGSVGITGSVALTNWPAVVGISGSQLTGSTFSGFPIVVGGTWLSGTQAGNAQYVKAIAVDTSGSVYITSSGTLPVAVVGQVGVSNFPATQNVSGTVQAWNAGTVGVSGSVSVTGNVQVWEASTVGVSGSVALTNWPLTLNVSASSGIALNNWPAIVGVSGSVALTNWPLTLNVSASAGISLNNWPSTIGVSGSVALTNWPAVIGVSGSQLTGSTFSGFPVVMGGTYYGSGTVGNLPFYVKSLQTDVSGSLYITTSGSLFVSAPPAAPVWMTGSVGLTTPVNVTTATTGTLGLAVGNAAFAPLFITGSVALNPTPVITANTATTGSAGLAVGNAPYQPLYVSITSSLPVTFAQASTQQVWTPGPVGVTGSVNVYTSGLQGVSGSVALTNWPSVIGVSGSQLTGSTFSGFPVVIGGTYYGSGTVGNLPFYVKSLQTDVSGSLYVTTSGSLPIAGVVQVSNFPATQNVSGSVALTNWPLTLNVSASAGISISNWPATIGVSSSAPLSVWNAGTVGISGTVTAAPVYSLTPAGVTGSVNVYTSGLQGVSGSVALTNWPSVVGVSGSQLTGSTFSGSPVVVGGAWLSGSAPANAQYVKAIAVDTSGSVYVTTSGTLPVAIVGQVGISNFPATQTVAGTVQVWSEGALPVSGVLQVSNFPATQNISGTVALTNWPATIGISSSAPLQVWSEGSMGVTGSVALTNWPAVVGVSGSQLTGSTFSGFPVVIGGTYYGSGTVGNLPFYVKSLQTDVSGSLYVTTSGSLAIAGAVSVTNFPATQTVAGVVQVSNFPATQNISGSVALTNWPATIGVSSSAPLSVWNAGTVGVSGTVTAAPVYSLTPAGVTGSVNVYTSGLQGVSGSVALTNWPAIIGVSGSQLTGSTFSGFPVVIGGTYYGSGTVGNLPFYVKSLQTDVSGSLYITTSGTLPVAGAVSVTNFPATQTVAGVVQVSNFPATQAVSGTVALTNWPLTLNVSASAGIALNNWPALIGVSGTVTAAPVYSLTPAGVTGSVNVYTSGLQGVSGSVALTNWPATVGVSGTQLTGSTFSGFPVVIGGTYYGSGTVGNLPFYVKSLQTDVSGSLYVTTSGTIPTLVTNFPATQTVAGVVQVSNYPAIQAVSGVVQVSNYPATQNVSGSVALTNWPLTLNVSASSGVALSNWPATIGITGSAAITNWPTTVGVSGSQLTGSTFSGFPVVMGGAWTSNTVSGAYYVRAIQTDVSGAQYITTSGTLPVAVTNFPATQTVAGVVQVSNFPATQNISASSGIALSNWPALIGVSGTVTAAPVYSLTPAGVTGSVNVYTSGPQAVTGAVNVYTSGLQGVSGSVALTNWPAVIGVSGSQLTGSTFSGFPVVMGGTYYGSGTVGNLPFYVKSLQTDVSGSLYVTTSGTLPVAGAVSVTNFPATQTVAGVVQVSNFPATQNISGSVALINWPLTLNVSASAGIALSNWPATVGITGSVALTNWPAVHGVSGSQLTGSTFSGFPVVIGGTYYGSGTVGNLPFYVKSLQTDVSGSLYITTSGTLLVAGVVQVSNYPAVQAVSGGVALTNWPALIGVSGTVNTAPVYSLTPAGVTGSVNVYTSGPQAVTGAVNVYTSGLQGISGSVTVGTWGTNVTASIQGVIGGNPVAVWNPGTVGVSGSLAVTPTYSLTPAGVTGSVNVYTSGPQAVSGTVQIWSEGNVGISGSVTVGAWALGVTGSTFVSNQYGSNLVQSLPSTALNVIGMSVSQLPTTLFSASSGQLVPLVSDSSGSISSREQWAAVAEDNFNGVFAYARMPITASQYGWSIAYTTALTSASQVKVTNGMLRSVSGRIDASAAGGNFFVKVLNTVTGVSAGENMTYDLISPLKLIHVSGIDNFFSMDFTDGIFFNAGCQIAASTTEFTYTAATAIMAVTTEYK